MEEKSKSKTPVAELRDWLHSNLDVLPAGMWAIIDKQLKREREMIVRAYTEGEVDMANTVFQNTLLKGFVEELFTSKDDDKAEGNKYFKNHYTQ